MERQRGDQRADGPLSLVIGREVGEATQGAPPRLHAPGQNRPRDPGAPNGDVNAELAEGRCQRDGAPYSPWTQEEDLSTRTSYPMAYSHFSVAGTVPWREAAPRATAWVSSA